MAIELANRIGQSLVQLKQLHYQANLELKFKHNPILIQPTTQSI